MKIFDCLNDKQSGRRQPRQSMILVGSVLLLMNAQGHARDGQSVDGVEVGSFVTAVVEQGGVRAADAQGSSELRTASPATVDSDTSFFRLSAEQWELARDGDDIMTLPTLKHLVQQWLEDPARTIEVQYPGGEEGEFWVQQLTDWLVALGIPSNHMVVVPGSGVDDMITLRVL